MVLGVGLLAGAANVIMQLAHPAVGHGVVESVVDSGALFRHPVKRGRTTITYLAVAALGRRRERELYQQAVNEQHALVRSGPSSPVSYDAFDPELQLWVAACLYKGAEDVNNSIGWTVTGDEAEALYREGARLGTTLQVPEHAWPPDRAAFERYWDSALEHISIDETVRAYLYDLAVLNFLPRPISRALGPVNRFVTTGFLPQRFRDEMRLPWSRTDQRRFDALLSALGTVVRHLPPVLRRFPFNLALWDLRIRIAMGARLV
jgi:uncharacterized protein (DUF2236 family)